MRGTGIAATGSRASTAITPAVVRTSACTVVPARTTSGERPMLKIWGAPASGGAFWAGWVGLGAAAAGTRGTDGVGSAAGRGERSAGTAAAARVAAGAAEAGDAGAAVRAGTLRVCCSACAHAAKPTAQAESTASKRKCARMAPTLSVVAPMHDEEGNVPEFVRRVRAAVESIGDIRDFELVLVNDGSRDGTLAALRSEASRDPRIVVIDLSRNFGHQLAATAALDHARGDAVILIDSDLQDPPELIPAMIAKWRAGFDVVYAVRRKREGESALKLWTARVFYRVLRRLTKVSIPVDTGDFRLMSRRVVDALGAMRERHRFIRGLVSWVGYPQTSVEYDRDARRYGETKYPFSKMVRFAIDGITSFSEIPLRFASYFGFIVSIVAFVVAVLEIGIRIFTGYNVPGYTSTIFAILFLGGVQLIGIGILGEYIGRVYDEIKGRPLYLVASVERASDAAREMETTRTS